MNINELVGCNVRGRLEFILNNLLAGQVGNAKDEVRNLMDFFPEEGTAGPLLYNVSFTALDSRDYSVHSFYVRLSVREYEAADILLGLYQEREIIEDPDVDRIEVLTFDQFKNKLQQIGGVVEGDTAEL